MRMIVFLLLIAFPSFLPAKDTKKINRINFYPNYNEVFYVLKSDNSIKHGPYKAETLGRLLVEGHFQMGVMDSIWTHFDLSGVIRSKGKFENNTRDGIWEFFDEKGVLEQKIDFSNYEVMQYRTSFSNQPFRVVAGSDTIMSILDRPPLYIGGTSILNDYIFNEIQIPLHKPSDKVTGIVYLSFMIDTLGRTSNFRVLKGIGKGCNAEALRVVKTIPAQWLPGSLDGKNVSVEFVLPVHFTSKMKETTLFPEDIEK